MKDINLKKSDLITGLEGLEGIGELELCIDRDHITITVDRFEELLKKEIQLDIANNIYLTARSYDTQEKLSFLFGPLPEKSDEDA